MECLYRASTPDDVRAIVDSESPIEVLSPSLEAFLSGLGNSRSPSPVAIALDLEETPFSRPSNQSNQTPQAKELPNSDELCTQRPSLHLSFGRQNIVTKNPPSSGLQNHPGTLCPERVTRAYELGSHLRIHTDPKESFVICNICGRRFARRDHRERHEKLHSVKNFVCRGALSGREWGRFISEDAFLSHYRPESGMRCSRDKWAEGGEIGDTWSARLFSSLSRSATGPGELSKNDTARHMSYTISEDYTNEDRVRRKRLYAFKRCYSRKDSVQSSTVYSPLNQGNDKLDSNSQLDMNTMAWINSPSPPFPFLPSERQETKNKITSIGCVFQESRKESEKVEDIGATSTVSRQTHSLMHKIKGIETGSISPKDATNIDLLERLKKRELNSSLLPPQSSDPEISTNRSDHDKETNLPVTHSPGIRIGDVLRLNDENYWRSYCISRLVGRS